jgi:hypothetical protein
MRKLSVLIAVLMLVSTAGAARAQVRFGPTVSWGEDANLGLGGRLLIPTRTKLIVGLGNLHGQLAFDYFFDPCKGVDCSYFEITPAAVVPLTIRSIGPVVGLGLNIAHQSVDVQLLGDESYTKAGLAIMGGLQFPIGGRLTVADARVTLGGAEQLVISLSYLFGGGGSSAAEPNR